MNSVILAVGMITRQSSYRCDSSFAADWTVGSVHTLRAQYVWPAPGNTPRLERLHHGSGDSPLAAWKCCIVVVGEQVV